MPPRVAIVPLGGTLTVLRNGGRKPWPTGFASPRAVVVLVGSVLLFLV
nr:hypothetical protein OG999_16420 [Streptomyces sp. NBC_00886]